MEVVDRILDVGRRNGVNAVLCAGDLFDDPTPVEDFWEGLARRLRDHPGPHVPVFLVPGNHDPLTTESVWAPTHPFRSRLPNWVHVVDRDEFSFELTPDANLPQGQFKLIFRVQGAKSVTVAGETFNAEGDQEISNSKTITSGASPTRRNTHGSLWHSAATSLP